MTDEDLVRELDTLYRTRLDTLRYRLAALEQSTARAVGLEQEHLPAPPPGTRGRPGTAARGRPAATAR